MSNLSPMFNPITYKSNLRLIFSPKDMSDLGLMSISMYMSYLSLNFNPNDISNSTSASYPNPCTCLLSDLSHMSDLMTEIFPKFEKKFHFLGSKARLGLGSKKVKLGSARNFFQIWARGSARARQARARARLGFENLGSDPPLVSMYHVK